MKNNIEHKKHLRSIATMAMLLYLMLPSTIKTEAQLLKVLPGNGNASKQTGPQGALRFQRGFYLVSPKEMLASGLAASTDINKVGFTIAYPQSDTTRGIIRIYLQNTTDTVSRYDSNWTEISVSDAYYWLSGLYPAKYEWQVKATCSGSSDYTSSDFFANDNLDPCLSPTSLRTTNITDNSATLRWVPPANTVGKFVVEYKAKDDADWTTDSTTSDYYDLTGLYSDSSYNWRVYARCNPDSSTYAHSSFVTADDSNCDLPTGLSATVIDDTSATISWTNVSGANLYNIRYRRQGVQEWVVATAFTTSYTIDTLLAEGSTYEWQVQTVCNAGKSFYVDGGNFTTTGTLACYKPTQLFVDSVSSTAARLSWRTVSGATGYTLRYRPKETIKWENAISPMTLVSDDSVFVPDSIGIFEIPFTNGSAFTYTGNGVYVAFEYDRSMGDLPLAGNYISTDAGAWNKGSQGQDSIRNVRSFASRQDSSLAMQDTVLAVIDYRPETYFGSSSFVDSVAVSTVYALGNIIPGTINKVDAVVRSYMIESPTVNVSLSVINKANGNLKYSSSTSVALNAGDTTMVSFLLPDQPVGETDSIVVSVPAQGSENILENNAFTYLQTFTNSLLGYNDGSSTIGSAGCDTLEGLTLIKIPLKDCSQAIGIKAYLSDEAEGQELYAVLLSNTGTIIAQSLPFTPGEDDVNGYHTFYFPTPAVVTVDSFYAGIGQMATAEGFAPVGVEWEGTLIRDSAYYRAKPDGDSLTQTKLPGRLKISVEVTKLGDYVTIDGSETLCTGSTATLTAAKINARYADSVIEYSSQNNVVKFSANQTLGAPNVYPSYTLSENSWIGSTASTEQYITLRFPGAAPINYVDIYETYNPGAVDSVYVKDPNTNSFVLVFDTTASPKASKARINRIKFDETSFNVSEVRIHLSPLADPAKGFNAIDAVSIGTISSPGTFDSYSWSPGGETTQSININSAGVYTLQTTTTGGCSGVDSIEVSTPTQVAPVISAMNMAPTTFCAGDSVTLSVDKDFGITWSTGETTKTIVVKTAGDYSATFDDGSGCGTTSSNTISVSVDTIPNISISGPAEVCAGSNIQLTATTGLSTYFWSAGSVSNTANIVSPGTYWVRGTNSFGCVGADTITITQATISNPTITGTLGFCPGDSTLLDAGNGFSAYSWSTGETSQTIYAKVASEYSVNVTNSSGCQGANTVTTTHYSTPTAVITGDLNFCPGGSTQLEAGATGVSSYLWSNGDVTQAISVNASGNYQVVVSNSSGCKDSTDVFVGTFANPVPKITGQLGICAGGNTTLTATPGFSSYSWSTGSTTNQAIVNTIGNVSVSVTDANGCTGSTSVSTIPRTLAPPVISGTLSFCAGNSTTLDAGSGYASYSWSTGAITQTITVTDVDTYSVTVTDIYGCSSSNSVSTTTNNALPVPPGPITGPTLGVCNTSNQAYSINPVSNTNFYVWFLPDGASFADNDTSSTTVKINFGPTFTGGVVAVAANNVCGQSAAINPTFISVGANAATPASIIGPTHGICGPVTKTYSVTPVAGASYTWTAPPNASVVGGQGTASVSIAFTAAFTNGDVCVKATTSCGTSPTRCILVRKEIALIGAISGPTNVCTKQGGTVYSIAEVPGATNYTWSVTNSATITAGQGTKSIKVDWNTKAGSVSVIANSACGSTSPKKLAVSMSNCGGGNVMTQNTTPATSEEIRLEPEVVANDGGEVTIGDINLQWTLGEPMVETLNGRGRTVSQGFHQPTIMVLRNPKDSIITQNGLRIIAAPNPVFSILKVHIFAEEETQLNLQLTNVLGNMKLNIPVKALTNTVEIKMDRYPQGIYFLTVQDKTGRTIRVIKVLKL